MSRPVASDVGAALASASADVVAHTLGNVRTFTRVHAHELGEYAEPSESVIRAGDERVRWAVELCTHGVVPKIFDAWTLAESRDLHPLRILVYQVLAQLLGLLSCHQPNHTHGDAIVEALTDASAPWTMHLQASVGKATAVQGRRDKASHDAVSILLALRLYTAMATYARGKFAHTVWERFFWTSDVHARLASMRRRSAKHGVSMHDMDVRTQYMAFLLSMLTQVFDAPLKSAVLELGADAWHAILRGLQQDAPSVVRFVLLVVHEDVCKDVQLARSAKARFLGDASTPLLALYARESEHIGPDTSVADAVHHFLLSVATHPGFGMAYTDRGFYGRDAGADGETQLHNKILLGLVRRLDVVHDLRQQELALRICSACPELLGPVLAKASLEVRGTDVDGFMHMAFVGRLLRQPLPPLEAHVPPPRQSVLQGTAPESVCRSVAKSLKSSNALVQYYACILYACMLARVCALGQTMKETALAAGEHSDAPGVWMQTLCALELAWRTRLPSIDLVAPLMHAPKAMQREAALRVLALYMSAVPGAALDTHWDVGHLLTRAFVSVDASQLHWERLAQMHVLRMLQNATAVDMTIRVPTPWPGHAARSYVHFVLVAYTQTRNAPAVRAECAALLQHWLGSTALFGHAPQELDAWLDALGDADANVLTFLDDCIQRALKTPYRYAERIRELAHGEPLSPLLAAVWEQAQIRLEKRLWEHSVADAILAYLTRLCVALVHAWCPAHTLRTLAYRLGGVTDARSMCVAMDAACIPPQNAAGLDAVLASHPATYMQVAAAISVSESPALIHVWLERLCPDVQNDLVQVTFDALDAWAKQHTLVPSWVARIWAHPTTQAWLARKASLFLCRLGAFLAECADEGSKATLAACADALYERDDSDAALQCITKLAPYASSALLVRMLDVPLDRARDTQLATLAALVQNGCATGEALSHLHTHLPALAARASTSSAACSVVDAVLDATLPSGLDPFSPPTHGSLEALAHARKFAPTELPQQDATAARLLYIKKGANEPVGRLSTLAMLDRGASVTAECVPACLGDPLACAMAAFTHTPALDSAICAALRAVDPTSPTTMCMPHMAWLVSVCKSDTMHDAVLGAGLPFLTRRFAEDAHDTPFTQAWTHAVTWLVRHASSVSVAIAEPLLEAIVLHRCTDTDAMRLACALARSCTLVKRASDKILHALVARTDAMHAAVHTALRRPCVALLVRLARDAPDAVATPTTMARILYLYTGTLDPCDTALRAILERASADVWAAWLSDKTIVPSSLQRTSILTALLSLEPAKAHAASVWMPRTAAQATHPPKEASAAYDPWLVLNLVGGAILEREQQGDVHLTGLEWLAILRTGALGVVMASLSSHRAPLRLHALRLLGSVYAALQHTSFREKNLVYLVLDRVRNTIPAPPPTSITGAYDEVPWLPVMPTLFAAHALHLIATPYSPMFPETFRFLLQRPHLDTLDVPMLYTSMHSSLDEWASQRAWILRFLTDALRAHALVARTTHPRGVMRAKTEWSAFKRRHVWDLILGIYAAVAPLDNAAHANAAADLRYARQIEELMLTAASIPHIAQDLVTRRGLLGWMSVRIANERMSNERSVFWLEWLHTLCVSSMPRHAAFVRFARLDSKMDGDLFLAVLTPAALVWRRVSVTRDAAQWALATLLALLEFAALHDTPRTPQDLMTGVHVLQPIVAWLRTVDDAHLHDSALRCTLLLSALGAEVQHLFVQLRIWSGHAWSYAPRKWAVHIDTR